MPNPSIKNERMYRALRRRGYSKEQAARISNAASHKAGGTLAVFKDATGRDRWASISSTAYRDRDGEIVSTVALKGAVALADATGERGPLRFWHVPGLDIGDCDYQAVTDDGRFLIESGTFRKPAYAAALKGAEKPYHVSIGFTHPAHEPVGGVFEHIAIFERSIVPDGRASNLFTRFTTKERVMPLPAEKLKALEALFGPQGAAALLSQVETTDKAAQAAGVAFKSTDPPDAGETIYPLADGSPGVVRDGRLVSLKSLAEKAPMAPGEMLQAAATEAADAVERAEAEAEDAPAAVTDDMDLADLTVGQFKALLGAFLGDVKAAEAGMAELKAQYEAMGKAFGAMQAQKDDSKAQIDQLKTIAAAGAKLAADVDKRLKELEGDTAPVIKGGAPPAEPQAVMPIKTELKGADAPDLTTLGPAESAYAMIFGEAPAFPIQ
jgi:hypothetical protein